MKPTMARALATTLGLTLIVLSLTSCANQGTAIMPNDPVCDVFPASLVTSMLPSGTYYYRQTSNDILDHVFYDPEFIDLIGACRVVTNDESNGYLSITTTYIDTFTEGYTGFSDDTGDTPCQDASVDVTPPRVGRIVLTGSCTEKQKSGRSTRIYESAWVRYWGGTYLGHGPRCTLIRVTIISRDGRDGVADATELLQVIMDFIDQSYAADPSAATGPTDPPGSTPTPPVPSTRPTVVPSSAPPGSGVSEPSGSST
jgi:hypothetical protein